jgi:DNA-binding HxlR family transcriptional regulator
MNQFIDKQIYRPSSVWAALEIVGDKPILLILESYWLGIRRFSDFCTQTGLLKTVVSDRLKKLIAVGCLQKTAYSTKPLRYEYRGTKKLMGMYPLALSMLHWEYQWGQQPKKINLQLTHTNCRKISTPIPKCLACRAPLQGRDVDWVIEPAETQDGVKPYSRRRKSSLVLKPREIVLFDEIADVIGDRWSALIIRSLFTRLDSFQAIQQDTQMATNVLSERLRLLLDKQIIAKIKQPSSRHMGYKLTQKGHDIYPVMLALMEWGSRWPTDHLDPPINLVHRPCGCRLKMQIACSACDQELLPKEVTFTLDGASLSDTKSSR